MAIRRIYPTQDTFVTDYDPSVPYVDPRFSNMGASEILNLYKWGTHRSEILIQFDIATVTSSFPLGSPHQYILHMSDAQHSEQLPAGYHAYIRPLEQLWIEGDGQDLDTYADLGCANFIRPTPTTVWTLQTGTMSSSFYFNTGHEDLEADVTDILESSHFGFDVLPETLLPLDTNFYIKKFHSRNSHFLNKRPYVEVRWTDWTGTLSTSSLFYVTSGPYSGTYWPDTMVSNSEGYSGSLITLYNSTVDPTGPLIASLYDLRDTYDVTEVVRLNLYARKRDWNPATVSTASIATDNVVLTNAYYRVVDVITGEMVIPFGTGALAHTKLSYNDSGSYFDFTMANLCVGPLYRIDILYEAPVDSGKWNLIQGDASKFRLTEVANAY